MAFVELNPEIENNIFAIPSTKSKEVRAHFERGDVVILPDVKIEADFDYLSQFDPPTMGTRRDKYAFWRAVNKVRDDRSSVWEYFRENLFLGKGAEFERFQHTIKQVNIQMDRIVRVIFNKHKFLTETITWKFHRNMGENIHLDNLQGCNDVAQVRLFVNLDSNPRQWAVGRHWRYYAERHYNDARLYEVVNNPFEFNGRLTQAAFGPSWSDCDEPRHLIEFAPGEIWLANSALVAHQVRRGNLLCTAHYEYPYRQYVDRSTSLPAQVRALSRRYSRHRLGMRQRIVNFLVNREM